MGLHKNVLVECVNIDFLRDFLRSGSGAGKNSINLGA